MSTRGALLKLGAALLLAGLVNVFLHWRYDANPGGTVELHLFENLMLLSPFGLKYYFKFATTYGIRLGDGLFIPHILMLVWLIKNTWNRLPDIWRKHALIACAINIPLWILFCSPGELRNLSMLYPTFVVMLSIYIDGVIRQ